MPSPSHLCGTLLLLLSAGFARTQAVPDPLPDVTSLMQAVETHQRAAETVEKDYLFDEDSTFNEVDSHGNPKKTEQRTFEIFWLEGVRVDRVIRKNNHELTPDEQKKENERVDKEVQKAKERRAKAEASGKPTDADGHEEVTLSRILELGAFTNPRREQVNGRPTILVDFTGNPSVKTHNPVEAALKVTTGTIWVDEQDKAVQHLEARFMDDFKLGGGLVASIRRGTWFKLTNTRINNEVWLPGTFDAQGQAHYLVFFSLNGNAHIRSSGYRKFKATSTILPDVHTVDPDPTTQPPPAPPN